MITFFDHSSSNYRAMIHDPQELKVYDEFKKICKGGKGVEFKDEAAGAASIGMGLEEYCCAVGGLYEAGLLALEGTVNPFIGEQGPNRPTATLIDPKGKGK